MGKYLQRGVYMAVVTKNRIINTFNDMLDRMPFDKITVMALIKECQISRNTFYYHYQNIYELLDDSLTKWLGAHIDSASAQSWQDVAKAILYSCVEHKNRIYNIYNSLSRDQISFYVFERISSTVYVYMEEYVRIAGGSIERAKLASEMITYTFSGFFMRFLWNDMQEGIEEEVDKLGVIFDEMIASFCGVFATVRKV